jgi:hypothetical protein
MQIAMMTEVHKLRLSRITSYIFLSNLLYERLIIKLGTNCRGLGYHICQRVEKVAT